METENFQKQLDRIEASILSQKRVLNFDDACLFTGLSKSHLYKLTSNQRVPHFKPSGKLVYFDRVELEEWLLQNRVTTVTEIEQQAAKYIKEKGAK